MNFFEYATGKNINEASFTTKDLNKVVGNLTSLLAKKTGQTYYHIHTHSFDRSNGMSGIGEMYYSIPDNKMWRFNFESSRGSSTLTSIDCWEDLRYIGIPTYTLYIPNDYNIVQSIDKMIPFFQNPKVGIMEARTKGYKTRADAMMYGVDPDDPDFYNKLDEKKKLVVEKGISEVNGLSQEIEKANDILEKTPEADPEILFEDLKELVKLVLTTKQPSLVITGGPGSGKCGFGGNYININIEE